MTKIADYDAIVRVLHIARPTEINRVTRLSRNSIYRYKNGDADILNMPLEQAIKLTDLSKRIDARIKEDFS